MKFKTTKKDIQANYYTIKAGYCEIQRLLQYESATAYTCGVYGWNADIYTFGRNSIVTGYRPFGDYSADYSTCQKYERLAKDIDNSLPYEEKKARLAELIERFIDEVINGEAASLQA